MESNSEDGICALLPLYSHVQSSSYAPSSPLPCSPTLSSSSSNCIHSIAALPLEYCAIVEAEEYYCLRPHDKSYWKHIKVSESVLSLCVCVSLSLLSSPHTYTIYDCIV